MECSISGQTVVSRHYAAFHGDPLEDGSPGPRRYYALGSPAPRDRWVGTVQTVPVSFADVVADIAALGVSGFLRWNPLTLRTPDGRQELDLVQEATKDWAGLFVQRIEAGDQVAIETQLRAGGLVRVRYPIRESTFGEAYLSADINVQAIPPFLGSPVRAGLPMDETSEAAAPVE